MILFLTLIYVALLLLLKSVGLIRLNLAWKLSPIVWFLFLNLILFIPMQWGAPSGPVGVFRNVIEIVPAVSGQVIDVPVEPLREVAAGEVLFRIDPQPFSTEVNRLSAALAEAERQPELLQSSVEIAEAALARATAEKELANRNLERSKQLVEANAASSEEYEEDVRSAVVADRVEKEAAAVLDQAVLKRDTLMPNGENTSVAQVKEQLSRAKYDLEQATVRAPSNGKVLQLALRPGARVAAMPMRGSMVFVETDRTRIAVAIQQNQVRFVKPGQSAEVVLKYLPGKTLPAKVVGIADLTSGGQVRSTGVIEDISLKETVAEPYQVVLELEDVGIELGDIPGGAVGIAAIYTDNARFTHLIRRVMIRMQSWINFVL